jgi:hypothetical protein
MGSTEPRRLIPRPAGRSSWFGLVRADVMEDPAEAVRRAPKNPLRSQGIAADNPVGPELVTLHAAG